MPPNSIILGVDLVPIKPIPRCITFPDDITSESCRRRIKDEIKDWKADIVLHDGAPNVGTAWAQDAFAQNELVLASLKLATEFLGQGGTFVTKVFRSKDYNSLMWVFNQLFSKVEATKPPSSRNVSAEIFVVCQGFHAPKRIDPRFLNPSHVFKDLDVLAPSAADALEQATLHKAAGHTSMDKLTPAAMKVFHPEKKRRAREGYDDGDLILFKKIGVMEFIKAHDPISVLGNASQLVFQTSEEKALLKSDSTSTEIEGSCDDLKVLGKKDFKNLLKWRASMREELGLDVKIKPSEEEYGETAEVSAMPELNEEEQMEEDLARIKEEEISKKRRDKRRSREKKMKEIQRLQLHMTTPMDIGLERQDQIGLDNDADFMFGLEDMAGGRRKGKALRVPDNAADMSGSDDSGDMQSDEDDTLMDTSDLDDEESRFEDLEANLDTLYDEYQNHKLERDAKHRAREARKKRDENGGVDEEWGGIRKSKVNKRQGDVSDDEEEADEDEDEDGDASEADDQIAYQRKLNGSDDEISTDESDTEDEENKPLNGAKRKYDDSLLQTLALPKVPLQSAAKNRAVTMWYDQPVFKEFAGLDALTEANPVEPLKNVSLNKHKAKMSMDGGGAKEDEVSYRYNKSPAPKYTDIVLHSRAFFSPASPQQPMIVPSKKRKTKQSDPRTWEEDDETEAGLMTRELEDAARIESAQAVE